TVSCRRIRRSSRKQTHPIAPARRPGCRTQSGRQAPGPGCRKEYLAGGASAFLLHKAWWLFAGVPAGQMFVTMTLDQMIVDHADRLHEGIDNGRADELEPPRRQFLRHLLRQRGFGRHLRGVAEFVDLRLAVEEIP